MATAITDVARPAATGTTAPAAASGTAAGQQDRFMKLLVAQMRNQDPLNPMDNAQMTSQVAQINTVSGIEKLNKTVESLLAAMGGWQSQAAMQLPGRDVLVDGDHVSLTDAGAEAGVSLDAAADTVSVEIVDVAGQVVRRIALGPQAAGVHRVTWDGQTDAGAAADDGQYQIRVAARAGDVAVAARPLAGVRVQSVSGLGASPVLDLGGSGTVPWSAVRAVL